MSFIIPPSSHLPDPPAAVGPHCRCPRHPAPVPLNAYVAEQYEPHRVSGFVVPAGSEIVFCKVDHGLEYRELWLAREKTDQLRREYHHMFTVSTDAAPPPSRLYAKLAATAGACSVGMDATAVAVIAGAGQAAFHRWGLFIVIMWAAYFAGMAWGVIERN